MGMTIPKPKPETQAKMDQLKTSTPEQRAELYANNPDITQFYADQETYERAKRAFMGLPQFDRYPTPSPEVQAMQDEYNALPSKNGPPKRDGTPSSPNRSAWIKANPDKWAQMTEQWTKQDIYNLQKEGAVAVYEGIDFTEDGIKSIQDIAKATGGSSGGFNFGTGGAKKEPVYRQYLTDFLKGVQPITELKQVSQPRQRAKFKAQRPKAPRRGTRIKLN
jgi:hypothetical protein